MCCSHPTQMRLKGDGPQAWQVLSHELLTPQPQGLCSNSAHIPHQEQCFVQMLLQLVVMPQTLAQVLSDVQLSYIGYNVRDLSWFCVEFTLKCPVIQCNCSALDLRKVLHVNMFTGEDTIVVRGVPQSIAISIASGKRYSNSVSLISCDIRSFADEKHAHYGTSGYT